MGAWTRTLKLQQTMQTMQTTNERRPKMFSYKAWKRSEKARKGRLYQQYAEEKKLLFVSKEKRLVNCWRFEKYYEKLDGTPLYQQWARGEGPIVRHLCSDGRCVNPLHLIRGTDYENAKDEIEVRDFEIEKFREILGDYSMEEEDKHLVHLTLLPKVCVKLREERGIRSLKDTNNYVRDMFRQEFVKKLKTPEDMSDVVNRLEWLQDRNDVSIIIIPGGA